MDYVTNPYLAALIIVVVLGLAYLYDAKARTRVDAFGAYQEAVTFITNKYGEFPPPPDPLIPVINPPGYVASAPTKILPKDVADILQQVGEKILNG